MKFHLADLTRKKYFFPAFFLIFTIISFLPSITQKPYRPEDTQLVIIELLKVALKPFETLGILFHLCTIVLIGWIVISPKATARPIFWYIGIDLIVIAAVQSFGTTETYGIVIHTGGLVTFTILGCLWIYAAVNNSIDPIELSLNWLSLLLMPFAVLSFWSPYRIVNTGISPDFNPVRLITATDYGLTFCFTTPVFLYLLYVLFPKVNIPIYRITAYVALLYALFNLTNWIHAKTRWMGVLHIPLLALSIAALIQTKKRHSSV